ncbi:hypothetical protein [Burkholderia sp. IDO3]|uniref:hypothetical protein n=1 Tax=Burkholderia sp. IDO3 TaxID=1705310 RepID=UPI000BBB590D|nr:hypothetical protein [Burkholderia sp. IDO3]AXK66458.1 hypothetical protein DCN14_28770 [Burkholderia sp. IDO3]PCD59025.1 hypothetical protein CN645_25780 [Burkholderia sp. IDO3]
MAGKESPITQMRTIAWLREAQRLTGAKGLTALANRYAQRALRLQFKEDAPLSPREFKQYANGQTKPSDDTLDEVEEFLPGTLGTFRVGPRETPEAQHSPLWLALGGKGPELRDAILQIDPPGIASLFARSKPFSDVITAVFDRFGLNREMMWEGIARNWMTDDDHIVIAAIKVQELKVSLAMLTSAVALWRLSLEINSEVPVTNYLMLGLHGIVAQQLLEPFGIYEHFKEHARAGILSAFTLLEAEREREARYADLAFAESDPKPTA